MAKKTPYKRKKREKSQQIDNIPKYSQQRRSPAPKRRTDFSLFFCSSSSSSSSLSNALNHQGSLLESSVTVGTVDDRKSKTMDMLKNSQVQCSKSQVLHRKEHLSSCGKWLGSLDGPNNSKQQGSVRIRSDFLRTRRGMRARKPKVHFDEVTLPLRSVRKVRRLRIMRYLGLAAPVGSPFSLSHPHPTAWTHFLLLDQTKPNYFVG